ncbi:MAG: ABC transporter ATP-binding protein [Desulfofustis sp.]|nr:ABC transporter ATP-binding protein [Desulfofustis sp.]
MKIELTAVEKYYNRGAPNQVHALRTVDLSITSNETVCIHGPSGSGKSTLLAILGGIIGPTSGSAVVDGRKLARLPDRFLTLYRQQHIGFIFQRFRLIPELSVVENVTLPLLPLGIRPAERKRRGWDLLKRLEIGHRGDFLAAEISGGELQRAAVARALINDPSIIVADEPTAHLDTRLSEDFLSIMAELKDLGKTIIIASHDPLVSGHPIVDRCLYLRDGRLTAVPGPQ